MPKVQLQEKSEKYLLISNVCFLKYVFVLNDFPEMWLTESLSSCIILYKKWVLLLNNHLVGKVCSFLFYFYHII